MELGTAIIALVILFACIMPFIVISRSNKKRDNQFLQVLSDQSKAFHLSISQYDIWNNAAIGTDASFNMIFFNKKSGDLNIHQQITLVEVEKCWVVNTNRTIGNPSGDQKVIDKLELAFNYRETGKPDTILVFYDANSDSLVMSGEIQLADKWCKIANDKIESLRQK